jgi:hypothetical protein
MPHGSKFKAYKTVYNHRAWWCVPVIPVLWKLRKEDLEFQATWGYTVRPCLKTNKQTNKP